MICKKIEYKNFRNIENEIFEPSSGITVLNGLNGQGKTNFLEGIYLFAGIRSFRTMHENELVRFNESSAELSMSFNNGKRDMKMTLRWLADSGKRFCSINGVTITKLSEMVGNFRAVLFCPSHLSIVKDGPSMRRKFIDSAISQIDTVYLKSLQRYNSILMQRNTLIKTGREKHDLSLFLKTNEMWAEQLAREAEFISAKRNDYIEKLNVYVSENILNMTDNKEKAAIYYLNPRTYSEYFKLLTENTEREFRSGMTLYGIHKDDLRIELCGKDARIFASQGQQRSIALSMKLSEGELSKEYGGEYPVFLFDDILSELDDGRKSFLLNGISGKQVIVTSCEKIKDIENVFLVREGRIL